MIGALLVILVGLCFYAGYKFALQRAIEQTLMVLEDDGIIRLVTNRRAARKKRADGLARVRLFSMIYRL